MASYKGDWNSRQSDEQGYAYNAFLKFFGREPSDAELAQATAAYQSGDANRPNVAGGDAFVAQLYQNQTNTPEKQAADQNAKYLADAPKYYDEINSQFQSTLGRDATQAEKEHFGSLRASGQVDTYTIGQFLNQLPDAVKKQDEAFRESLRSETSAADARYFNEQVLPGIQRNFAQSGRDFNSSGFTNAAAQAAQQQNVEREKYLTGLSADQYSGNKTAAYNDYLNSVGRLQAGQDYSRQRRDQLTDSATSRLYDIQNFNMQKQAYDEYLKRYGKRSGGLGGLIGGAVGTGVGAYFGGPMGAMAGNQIGSGFGNYFGA